MESEVGATSFIIQPLQLFITSPVKGQNSVANSERLRQNLMKIIGSMLFYLLVFPCSAFTSKGKAFIFHNQAEDGALEGMSISLAKLTSHIDVEQLQNLSPTEFLVLSSEEFGAFHKLRLEKSVIKAWSLAWKFSFSIGTTIQYDLAHDVTNMNHTLSKNPSLLDTKMLLSKTTLCWQRMSHAKISLS